MSLIFFHGPKGCHVEEYDDDRARWISEQRRKIALDQKRRTGSLPSFDEQMETVANLEQIRFRDDRPEREKDSL